MTLFATPYYVTFNHRNQILISDCDANSVKVLTFVILFYNLWTHVFPKEKTTITYCLHDDGKNQPSDPLMGNKSISHFTSSGWGGQWGHSLGPVKISNKKDGRQRPPHRFHVFAPPPPGRWIRYCFTVIQIVLSLQLNLFWNFFYYPISGLRFVRSISIFVWRKPC